jgi:2-oxo-3-hexenedioate decarboxylase
MTPEEGYAAARALHEQRLQQGWRAVGRKIGFTNRTIWPLYGVYEPIWGVVYEQTLVRADEGRADVALAGLTQPRIEPEICFKLRAAPRSAAPDELLSCLEWVAHSVEIVQCRQPGWKGVTVASSTAENGLHGRLIVGTPLPIPAGMSGSLPRIEVVLRRDQAVVDRGVGENVLGSPLLALGYLVGLLAKQPRSPALAAGEIITTGTLTDAHPVAPGETWTTQIRGLPLNGLALRFS